MKEVITEAQQLAQKLLKEQAYTLVEGVSLRYLTPTLKPAIIISISKKVAPHATVRNRVKRKLRAIIRTNLSATVLQNTGFFISVKINSIAKEAVANIVQTLSYLFPKQ